MINYCKSWYQDQALPHWLKHGFNEKNGSFAECLSFETGQAIVEKPRRAMVQARQIYVVRQAMRLGYINEDKAKAIIKKAIDHFIKYYFKEDGSVVHTLDAHSEPVDTRADLYGQSFALFGLAQAYAVIKDKNYLDKAYGLLKYLRRHRAIKTGGFTEFANDGSLLFASNPHMHLLEAAIALIKVDSNVVWVDFARELVDLCLNKFRDTQTGLIGENFNQDWQVDRNTDGLFMFEPGHQYEWAWLIGEYEALTGETFGSVKKELYDLVEAKGVHPETAFVYDEVLSNFKPQKLSSRFWPQCERVKLALQFAQSSGLESEKEIYFAVADEALSVLIKFLETPIKGLWYDTQQVNGDFEIIPAKGSSFYHIVGAISDYIKLRKV